MKYNPKELFGRIASLIVLTLFFIIIIVAFTVSETPARYAGYGLIGINMLLYLYVLMVSIVKFIQNLRHRTNTNDFTMHSVNLFLSVFGTVVFGLIYTMILFGE